MVQGVVATVLGQGRGTAGARNRDAVSLIL